MIVINPTGSGTVGQEPAERECAARHSRRGFQEAVIHEKDGVVTCLVLLHNAGIDKSIQNNGLWIDSTKHQIYSQSPTFVACGLFGHCEGNFQTA
ncbi:MAG: hypothetical protein HYX66_09765 [Ignavibacteria bacterium]|nr:hypothetical protein [Ignavibacteria bacterium]